MFCQACGKEIASASNVCAACGHRVGASLPKRPGEYGGIGRLGYWIGSVLCFGGAILFSVAGGGGALFGSVLVLVVMTVIMFQRLMNIGWNGWLALLGLIPLVALFVSIPSAIFPEGYAATKKLDRAGKILAGILVASIALLVIATIPVTVNARGTAQRNACMNNMRMLDSAKEQAALEHNYRDGATVPESEVSEYLKKGFSGLVCPKGGRYTINPLGQDPACSEHGALSGALDRR